MPTQLFSIFDSFAHNFTVQFFTKQDAIHTDADLGKKLHGDRIVSLKQVHGNRVVTAREPGSRIEEADGIITDSTNLWLSIRAADCQQLIIYAPMHHVAGVMHAGWKGVQAGVIPEFFATLQREWGVTPAETYVGIGPSLCTDCAEFSDPARELAGLDARFFHARNADLQGIANAQLDALGIPAAQRERSPHCTKCMPETYWTYRGGDREEVKKGCTNVMVCRLME